MPWTIWKNYGPFVFALLAIEFFVTFTFFMFVPFISLYLTGELGYSLLFAGVILAVRLVSQQGVMLIGGYFGDKYGHKKMMMIGFLCRGVGFAGLGLVETPLALIVMAIIGGIGGTFFSPSLKAVLVSNQPKSEHKTLFAYSNISANAGTIIGPLFGTLFSVTQFPLLSVITGLSFALMSFWIFLVPIRSIQSKTKPSLMLGLTEIIHNRSFLLVVVALIPFHFIYQQLFLVYPLIGFTLTGSGGWIFTVLTLLVVACQMTVTRLSERLSMVRSIQWGYLAMALGFIPLFFHLHVITVIASLIGIALGVMLIQPTFYSYTVSQAPTERFALYIGFSNLAMAIGGALGNIIGGSLYEWLNSLQLLSIYWVIFAIFAFLPIFLLQRILRTSKSPAN
ncbi:hypothetical protein DH09_15835 [Bacillaceae bacterium JMAK1]|nr:hypothetical protein DH09_15835 [Bacillaceae bacterium JMAK1]